MELGASDAPDTSGPHIDFRGGQHADERRREIDPQGVLMMGWNRRRKSPRGIHAHPFKSSSVERKVKELGLSNGFYDHDLNEWNNWNFWNLGHRCAHITTNRHPSSSAKTAPYWTGLRISAFTNQ
jgi:hypothetical protein